MKKIIDILKDVLKTNTDLRFENFIAHIADHSEHDRLLDSDQEEKLISMILLVDLGEKSKETDTKLRCVVHEDIVPWIQENSKPRAIPPHLIKVT